VRQMRTLIFVLLWSFVLTSPSLAESTRQAALSLTLENIFTRANGAAQAAISSDGKWVAVTTNSQPDKEIYLVSVAEAGVPKLWVKGNSPAWSPDDKNIVFSRAGDLFTVGIGSSQAKQVTKDFKDVRNAVFSPDGKWLAFYSTRSGSQDIWLVPADGSVEPHQLTKEANAQDDFRYGPSWSPDSKRIAFVSDKSNYWHDDVWVVDVGTGESRQLSHSFMANSTPAWSPDGKKIAVQGVSKDLFWYLDMEDIYVLASDTGVERKLDMQVYATDWIMSLPIFWSGDGNFIYFMYQERGDFDLWSVPEKGGVATRVTNMGGSFGWSGSYDASKGAGAFVFVRSTPTAGPDVYYVNSLGGQVRRLTRFAQTFENVRAPEVISYKSFDGLYIEGFLYLPPDMKAGHRYPALVQVHGGGTNSYLHGESLTEQYLASKGYIVLAINYRGGSGFGRRFQDLSVKDWGGGQALDAAAAADFLRSLPYCNGKVGIYGYSYGGIMSMAAITQVPDKFDAAVPMAGIYDFADAYRTADRVGKVFTMTGHGGSPEDQPGVYARSNAMARIQSIRTPLLIMHGEADVRAPFRQYQQAVELLKKYGKDFQSKSFPNEQHGFHIPQDEIEMFQRLETFFDAHLKSAR
jgi:dipeptidyl aminopeptidase/acylaminoacyl peptidase